MRLYRADCLLMQAAKLFFICSFKLVQRNFSEAVHTGRLRIFFIIRTDKPQLYFSGTGTANNLR